MEATTPVKLPTKRGPCNSQVRNQTAKGPYFNSGSTNTGVPDSLPPAYPTCSLLWVFNPVTPSPSSFSICQTFLCFNPQSGSRLIEFAPPFHLCDFQVPALQVTKLFALNSLLYEETIQIRPNHIRLIQGHIGKLLTVSHYNW